MLYYKVKEKYDNKPIYKRNKRGNLEFNGILIGNELFTPKEFWQLKKVHENVHSDYFEQVNIKKTRIYFFFGARFEMDD